MFILKDEYSVIFVVPIRVRGPKLKPLTIAVAVAPHFLKEKFIYYFVIENTYNAPELRFRRY